MASVSVVIQFFEDFDFIERVVELLAWVDEIVINDGPFTFTRELLEPLVGRDLGQPSPRAAHLLGHLHRRLGVPIHYNYGLFRDEREKRIHGYGLARGDVVLSVDADELLLLGREDVERFWDSPATVASFDCVNFTYLNLVCGKPGSPLVARKPFAFKRAAISAEHHLDYLWLVGVKQAAVAAQDFLPEALCTGAHLTTVRSSYGASIKFGFYNCLYYQMQGSGSLEGSFREAREFFALGRFSGKAQAEVYARALPDAMGFPNQQFFRYADPREVPAPIRTLADEACAPFNEPLPHQSLQGQMIPGVPVYALMKNGRAMRVSLTIGGEARVRLLPLFVNGAPLDLNQPVVEHRWQARALEPRELSLEGTGPDGNEAWFGHLVELMAWTDTATKEAWARAFLTPGYSLSIVAENEEKQG